jgi:hypothetical protein
MEGRLRPLVSASVFYENISVRFSDLHIYMTSVLVLETHVKGKGKVVSVLSTTP